jgi:predicted nucleic acid-binding protein
MPVVIDASVAIAWSLEDEGGEHADRVAALVEESGAVVPQLWGLEVANVLLMAERRNRITKAFVQAVLADLRDLPIDVDPETFGRAGSEILELARVHSLSVYDAAYLELALRRGLPLATQDKSLLMAAAAAGVAVVA